jgi:hypothetical protein
MKIYDEITINMETGEIMSERSFDYDGPLVLCDGGGGGGGDAALGDISTDVAFDPVGFSFEGATPEANAAFFGGQGISADPGTLGAANSTSTLSYTDTLALIASLLTAAVAPVVGAVSFASTAAKSGLATGTTDPAFGTGVSGPEGSPGVGGGPAISAAATGPAVAPASTLPGATSLQPGSKTQPAPAVSVDPEEQARQVGGVLEERRRSARRRMGYWSTMRTRGQLGPLNIFTPQLYGGE